MTRTIHCFLFVLFNLGMGYAQIPTEIELIDGEEFVDAVFINDRVLMLTSSEEGNWLTYDGERSSPRGRLNMESPEKLVIDDQLKAYVKTADSVYKVSIGESIQIAEPESTADFDTRLQEYRGLGRQQLKFKHYSGAMHVYYHHPVTSELEDSIIITADYRSEAYKRYHSGATADQSKNLHQGSMNSRTPYPGNRGGSNVINTDSLGRPTIIDHEPVYERRMQETRSGQYTNDYPNPSRNSSNPLVFLTKNGIVIIDGDRERVIRYSKSGELLSNVAIDYDRPLIWSRGSDDFIYNLDSDRVFICSTNSKGIQFSQLNAETGIATNIFKLEYGLGLKKCVVRHESLVYVQTDGKEDRMFQVDLW